MTNKQAEILYHHVQAILIEVEFQCSAALNHFSIIETSDYTTVDTDIFFFNAQNFLFSSAIISNLLWPKGRKQNESVKKFKVRAQPKEDARILLELEDDSPLMNRKLRNHYAHIDERIDKWAETSVNRHILDRSIIAGEGQVSGIANTDYLRTFDPTRMTLTFRNKHFPVLPLAAELRNIKAASPTALHNLRLIASNK